MAHGHSFGRASIIRKEKKARVGHPLTNTELICVGLALFHEAGVNPQSHQVRKFVYLQKFGDMKEWGSTWYHGYFQRANYPYTDDHPNVGSLYRYTEKGRTWRLTPKGWDVASKALDKLAQGSGAGVGDVSMKERK